MSSSLHFSLIRPAAKIKKRLAQVTALPPDNPSGILRIMEEPAPTKPAAALTPEKVFTDYAPRIYNLARRMLASDVDAEDVTQDVLLQVVRKLDTFRGESAFPTWLHRVTVNAALAHRKKRAQQEDHRAPDPLEHFLVDGQYPRAARPWSVAPDQQALDQETHRLIEEAIAKLPEVYRDVYVLADV